MNIIKLWNTVSKTISLRTTARSAMGRLLGASLVIVSLSACSRDVMSPAGDIAVQLRNVMGIGTFLMLLIVLPVMVAVCLFAWYYRASNKQAAYSPDFHHSTSLELLTWAAPLTIVVWLGAVTWVSTHQLDPYRPLDRIDARTPLDPGVEPLVIQTVSMDWKWMFFYPEYGIATINEVAAPIDRPIKFELTSTEVMNAFHIPAVAGMIYTMAGMETTLWAVGNDPGEYEGRSSHYSGAGFSGMSFQFHILEEAKFETWINTVGEGESLDRERFFELMEPSESVPPTYFSLADEELYHDILNRCLQPDQVCMDDQMMEDHMRQTDDSSAESEHAGHGGHGDHNEQQN
ncbi:ubiquinol oxidase subunit II [Granulosicoccus sp.]|nr:ubiquinol oxidase subunit II [Granulosicoccus sp.]